MNEPLNQLRFKLKVSNLGSKLDICAPMVNQSVLSRSVGACSRQCEMQITANEKGI